MSTFFEMLKGRIREKQQFSEMFITFFCPTYAQPAKDIGFYIVSLVGQVLFNYFTNCLLHLLPYQGIFLMFSKATCITLITQKRERPDGPSPQSLLICRSEYNYLLYYFILYHDTFFFL